MLRNQVKALAIKRNLKLEDKLIPSKDEAKISEIQWHFLKLIKMIYLKQWFSTRGVSPHSWGHLAMSGDIFACHSWSVSLVSSRKTPGMLLSILYAQANPPQQRTYLAQNVFSAEIKKS